MVPPLPGQAPGLLSRRQMLQTSALGFGALALSSLLHADGLLAAEAAPAGANHALDLKPRPTHLPARARAVIMLMQNGGPSQMDLFDPKPALNKLAGKTFGVKVETFQKGSETNTLLGTPFKFQRHGQCGMDMAEVLPHLGRIADDLCLVRSMFTEHNNHTEALVMLTSAKIFPGRPTLGAWISYALGTPNQNLPAYIVLRDPQGYPGTGATLWQNGWLPPLYRGTEFSSQGPPVLDLHPARSLPPGAQQEDLNFLARVNELHHRRYPQESALETRIRNYELAARMQLAAGQVLDLSRESAATRKLYGLENPVTAGYGLRCLMARRLVEAGVRFVQVFPGASNPWDSHNDIQREVPPIAAKTDLPSAALISDLKARGLLGETIVIWAGEFGRLPISQRSKGRDHNRNGFSLLLAGGGFKAGCTHGTTDEVGYRAVEGRVSVPDLFATLFHQLGLDHSRLTYRYHGRDETPTDAVVTKARVVHELLA